VPESGTGSKPVDLTGGSAADDAYAYLDVPRRDMVDFVPVTTTHMLDVGCGQGGFGRSVKMRAELEVTGIEVDPQAASVAASRYEHVITGTFPDEVPAGAEFDCIVFNDILEHLVDPWEALREAARLLAPGGVVVASIPNMRYWPIFWPLLTRGEWRYVSDGVLDRTHLRFFTLASAKEMFTDSGFTIVRATPINLAGFDQLQPRSTLVLKAICRLRRQLGQELRAQQFAIVATPRPRSEH
jgi:2-polyprenyl-3-methyl-5-hydroxy-6-metoxy-1,4-benzoquinol methylase